MFVLQLNVRKNLKGVSNPRKPYTDIVRLTIWRKFGQVSEVLLLSARLLQGNNWLAEIGNK